VVQFFTDYNLLAAGSVLVALPTLIVFFALAKAVRGGPGPSVANKG
jgi:multiple sugar transport system permease protein